MNCDGLNEALIERGIVSLGTSEAQDHLNSCKRCGYFVAAISQPVSEAPPSSATLRPIESELVPNCRNKRIVLCFCNEPADDNLFDLGRGTDSPAVDTCRY